MPQATRVREEQTERSSAIATPAALGRIGEYPRRARQFLRETRNQLKLVTWPGAREVYSTTIVVVVTVAFFAAFFYMTDSVFGYASRWIIGHFKH